MNISEAEIAQAVEMGLITKSIERYYEEKLDKRPRRDGFTASLAEQMFALN